MPNAILDPTGLAGPAGLASDRVDELPRPAQRSADLSGARIGLLDNTKHNALLFLREVGRLLVEEYGAAEVSIVETKQNFSIPIDDEIAARYRAACDVVVTGVGDCGSCSAAAVADGIRFERAGLPAAVILTDAFDTAGRRMAELQGHADYDWITTAHPVAVLEADEVRTRARSVVAAVAAAVTSGGVR